MRKLAAAADFAAKAHSTQRRKDSAKTPYINHPISVCNLVAQHCEDVSVLMAALLHDVVEDCGVSVAELERQFGLAVAGIVAECTDDKALPKDERKRQQISHASLISVEAKIVKLADKLDNCRGLLHEAPPSWSAERVVGYFVWSKAVCDQLVSGCTNQAVLQLAKELDGVFASSFSCQGKVLKALPPVEEREAFLKGYLRSMAEAND